MASKKSKGQNRKAEKRLARQLERVVNRHLCFWLLVATIRDDAETHHEGWRNHFLAELDERDMWAMFDGLTREEVAEVIDTIDRSLSWDQPLNASEDGIKGLFSWELKTFPVST